MISIVIPSRNERFLEKTINDVLLKARGDIEVIAVLDGYWPAEIIGDPRVSYIHYTNSRGMRYCINAGVAQSRGSHILKLDGHCMVDEGYDVKLVADCDENWVVTPRRHRLEPEAWVFNEVNKPPIDYEYLSYPNNHRDWGGAGLHARQWTRRTLDRMNDPKYDIDDNMSFQGSGWFMHKKYFYDLELMDDANYGPFWQEAQEIGLKAWLSGGMVKINKKTWYAHLHKGKKYGRGYAMDGRWLTQGVEYTKKWLLNTAWHKQTKPLSWLIEYFWPVPEWPEDRSVWKI